jgi:hypothetical protein
MERLWAGATSGQPFLRASGCWTGKKPVIKPCDVKYYFAVHRELELRVTYTNTYTLEYCPVRKSHLSL